ncbi:sugar transferase [Antarcticirhabdus aurantiaca]|uniref:Sugar transferase n=1 Tax=Antarcticirhabdus aurantiaca TaxID=2606717 RepID=A0ACD4NM34_9HYPH|nr:sugar transferase [Antarcticirhabdus aurantiaca]WAJ27960.1 sugar transferase [Jeongeuplla avenae]
MTALLGNGLDGLSSERSRPTRFFGPRGATGTGAAEIASRERSATRARRSARRRVHSRSTRRLAAGLALAAGDAAAFLASLIVLLPFGVSQALPPAALLVAAAAAIAMFWLARLYPGYRLHDHERLRRRALATLELGAAAGLAAWLLAADASKAGFLAAFLGLALGFQLAAQEIARALLHRAGLWGENAAIIGSAPEAKRLRTFLRRDWRYGLRPAREERCRVAVLATIPTPDELERLRRDFAEIILVGGVADMTSVGRPGEIGLTLAGRRGPAPAPLDRVLDLAIALPAAVLFLPVIALAALAIRLVDPGPVLYRQMREGLGGRPFPVLKLRTMYLDAEARLDDLLRSDPAARREWNTHFKLRQDPRILPYVGRFLRASSIDELPQLFNVIAGSMRIVGPRPFPGYHLAAMDAEFRARRCRMKPGITGLWQISGRSAVDVSLQQQFDDFYMEHRSFWFDLHIILNTVSAILRGRGAY